jgi:hypothetical protein
MRPSIFLLLASCSQDKRKEQTWPWNLDHDPRCKLHPAGNLPPILIRAELTFKPAFQVNEISEPKEPGVSFSLCGPDGIVREVGIRYQKPNAEIRVLPRQQPINGISTRLLVATVVLHLPCDHDGTERC